MGRPKKQEKKQTAEENSNEETVQQTRTARKRNKKEVKYTYSDDEHAGESGCASESEPYVKRSKKTQDSKKLERKGNTEKKSGKGAAAKPPKTSEEESQDQPKSSNLNIKSKADSASTGKKTMKSSSGSASSLDVPKPDPKAFSPNKESQPLPTRDKNGDLKFRDHPEFVPNLTPKEVLQSGSFGGTYFRDIYSGVLGENLKDVWKELPEDWLEGLDIKTQVASQIYRESRNKYRAKCGGSLQMWEESGWIKKQDPYGWFQWYCRFYQGRRTKDDERQISRWAKCAGERGRWRNNLVTKIYKAKTKYTDPSISPVVRQVLLHWGYELTEEHYKQGAKAAAQRLNGK